MEYKDLGSAMDKHLIRISFNRKSTVRTKKIVFEIIIKNIYISLYRVFHGFRQNEARSFIFESLLTSFEAAPNIGLSLKSNNHCQI